MTRYCLWCGKAFTPHSKAHSYCSEKCEYEGWKAGVVASQARKPGHLLQPEIRLCRHCRSPFVTNHEGRRYCSDRCKYEHRKKPMPKMLQTGALL